MSDAAVQFGIQLPIQSQSTIYAQPWEHDAGVDELVDIAQACDRAGFLYVAVCDHVAIPSEKVPAMSATWWDTIATLGYLAAVTERVQLLSHVYVLPYRHPLVTAKQWMTLDKLSGGRAILGVGAGHVEGEFEALGIDFADRGRLLDEAIDAVRECLGEEYPTHEGTTWRFADVAQEPRPVREPLPIWVGGSSKAAMRRAAERGDGWLPQGPPEMGMAEGIAFVRAHRERTRGDDPIVLGTIAGPLYVGELPDGVGPCTSGPAGKVAHYLSKLVALGVDQIQVGFKGRSASEVVDQIGTFASDVIPLVEGAA